MKTLAQVFFLLFITFGYAQTNANCLAVTAEDANNNPNVLIDCNYPLTAEKCVVMHANYQDIKQTNTYVVNSVDYNLEGSIGAGTKVVIPNDDTFSEIIDLPFNFCFFGQNYSKIVIGDNGIVSFDLNLAHADSPFFNTNLPNSALYNTTIYGLFHDITNDSDVFGCTDDPTTGVNECGEISYTVSGVAPCRKFIVNYNNLNHFNCENRRSSFQIILYESTNEIRINIVDKPINSETSPTSLYRKNATIGIQNQSGLLAFSPENRNNKVFEASNESWSFQPNGESVVSFNWYNENNEWVATGEEVNICAPFNQTYSLEAVYNLCSGNQIVLNDNFNINYDDLYPSMQDFTLRLCDNANNLWENLDFQYILSQMSNHPSYNYAVFLNEEDALNNSNAIVNPINHRFIAGEYFIRSYTNNNCFDVGKLTLELSAKPYVFIDNISVCDFLNDSSENITFTDYISQIISSQQNVEVTFYSSISDAQNRINAITNRTISEETTIYIRIDNTFSGCNTIRNIVLSLKPTPVLLTTEITHDICSNTSRVNLMNFLPEDFPNSPVSFHRTLTDAMYSSNPISNPNNFLLNNASEIYAVIFNNVSCYSVFTIHFNYLESLVTREDLRVQCDSNVDNQEIFDLTLSIPDMIDTNLNFSLSYYTSLDFATAGGEEGKINNPNAYITDISTNYVYVRFVHVNGCVSINRIKLVAVPIPSPQRDEFELCDTNNDQTENALVSIFDAGIIRNQQFVVNSYYLTEEDAINGINPINSITVAPEITIYVRMTVVFEEEELCYEIYPIDLMLNLLPTTTHNLNTAICDNNANGSERINLTNYLEQITAMSGIYTPVFKNSSGAVINNPNNFLLNHPVTHIFVYQRDNEDCFSNIKMIINLETLEDVNDVEKYICDEDEDGVIYYNLTQLIPEMNTIGTNNPVEFYKTQNGLNNQQASQRITNPQNYMFSNDLSRVFVRFSIPSTSCFTTGIITLKKVVKPIVVQDIIHFCDNDNQGYIFIENLSTLDTQILNNLDDTTITYFTNLDDAENNQNPITNYNFTSEATIYIRIAKNNACYVISPIYFTKKDPPIVENISKEICDNNNDISEIYDLTQHETEIANGTYLFAYYFNEIDAQQQTNAIQNPENYNLTQSLNTIYVRVSTEFGCYSVAIINIELAPTIFVVNTSIKSCDQNNDLQETFNLTNVLAEMNSDYNSLDVKFYRTYTAAFNQDVDFQINNPSEYTTNNIIEDIYVRFTDSNTHCFSIGIISIEILKLPKLVDSYILVCDEDFNGAYNVNLTDLNPLIVENTSIYTFQYFSSFENAQNQTSEITNFEYEIQNLNEGVFVLVTNENGCSSIIYMEFRPNNLTRNYQGERINFEQCDDNEDGIETFDLEQSIYQFGYPNGTVFEFYESLYNAQNQIDIIENTSAYQNITPTQLLFVRITEEGKCSIIETIRLKVNAYPTTILEEEYYKCPNETMRLDAGANAATYLWNTGETTRTIEITEPGEYWVTMISNKGCEKTYYTRVINYLIPIVSYTFTQQHSVVINVEGESTYSYSLDGITWQRPNSFRNLEQGIYTVYVRDEQTGCVNNLKILVFDWDNALTPNGDGVNDIWRECNLEAFGNEMSHIKIFDRYGKTIYEQESNSCFEWDGHYLGRPMPTDTYWFMITLPDGRKFSGFIMSKNYRDVDSY